MFGNESHHSKPIVTLCLMQTMYNNPKFQQALEDITLLGSTASQSLCRKNPTLLCMHRISTVTRSLGDLNQSRISSLCKMNKEVRIFRTRNPRATGNLVIHMDPLGDNHYNRAMPGESNILTTPRLARPILEKSCQLTWSIENGQFSEGLNLSCRCRSWSGWKKQQNPHPPLLYNNFLKFIPVITALLMIHMIVPPLPWIYIQHLKCIRGGQIAMPWQP
jgi:hypothetical protein